MPDFSAEEALTETPTITSKEVVKDVPEKKRGRTKTCTMTEEEKKARQGEYYQKTKEQRLKYKQALRGSTKVPSNRCYMHTHYLPRYVREGNNSRPKVNIDWMNYSGVMRTLTISQPSDDLLSFLNTHFKLHIEESFQGTLELADNTGLVKKNLS